jgi:hypothetical protein
VGKRSNFDRRERDFYPTPKEAVEPLLRHLDPGTKFIEPCAGDGALVDHLRAAGHICIQASDIEPRRSDIHACDALSIAWKPECFITNPPWDRGVLHPLVVHLSNQAPTWLLFDADWVHTRQAEVYLPRLRRIVSVGRVKWIPNTTMTGKDNCAWHLFSQPHPSPATFWGRK